MTLPVQPLSYRSEISRKLIHLSSLWMPAAIYFLPWRMAAALFAAGLFLLVLFEIVRRQDHSLARWLNRLFMPVLRAHETGAALRLTGATYVLLAALASVLLFTQPVAIVALSIMLVADSAASLVGRRFGKTPLMGKTAEGSAAFLLAALMVILIIGQLLSPPPHYYAGALAAAAAATLSELCCGVWHMDDNLCIPLTAGGVMSLVMAML